MLKNFIIYLCYLRKIYDDKNIIYKIISNFLEYSEHLLDIALNNIEIYDLYHFNKETIIYSYLIDDDKKISLNKFQSKYTNLLNKCEKKKYLSQKMLELICKKYEQKDAISPDVIFNIKNRYLKQIKINIKKEVFSGASSAKLNYLTISSAFQEIKDELQLIKLKIGLNKLNGEIVIDNYLNSYLNIPAEFLSLRKSSSIILNKLIKKNHEKLNFIKPSKKIINSTLDLIFKIKKNLDEGEVGTSLRDKLNKLESILSSYIKGKKNDKPLYKLKTPLIKLDKVERNLLSFILKNDAYKFSNKISVADSDDSDLDFIINFFFELKNKASETIHINEKENLQFFSLFKKLEELPEKNDIKSDNASYSALINIIFPSEKNDFLEKENKVDYLLTLVDIKDDNLCNVKNKYLKYKKSLDKLPEKLINIIDASYFEIDEERYKKFINKYGIKKNSKEIFEYLGNIIEYIMPYKIIETIEDEEKVIENDSINNYKKREVYTIDIQQKYFKKEEELRNNILDLFEKDPKFITYITNYYWIKLNNYVKDNRKIFMDKIQSMIEKMESKYLLYLKLKKMKNIFSELKKYRFNIQEYFNNFVEEHCKEYLPTKKKKISEKVVEEQVITNFNYFIERLKEYICDINEKVELTDNEPGEFVLKLFLEKIGFNIY